jgi:hypothetical protein
VRTLGRIEKAAFPPTEPILGAVVEDRLGAIRRIRRSREYRLFSAEFSHSHIGEPAPKAIHRGLVGH